MKHKIFDDVNKIPGVKADFFYKLLGNAPEALLDNCSLVKIKKDMRFITAEEPLDKIRILLAGRVKALEEYVTGDIYIFTRFNPPEIFGEMEAIADIPYFRASLIAETECVCATIPVAIYIKFLKSNPDLLFSRVQTILKRISNDQKENRFYLTLNATDRIKLYLVQQYKKSDDNGGCVIRKTRQQIADETSYSVKTINRVIKKLAEENVIITVGQKIILNEKQYDILVKSINDSANATETEL